VLNDLGLQDVTLVGQDVGGMVAYAYARTYELARVVIADVVIPGVDPWDGTRSAGSAVGSTLASIVMGAAWRVTRSKPR
jgi:pimeloyl-ACP methyl ester carboxylesterase